MRQFATLDSAERATFINEAAARLGVVPTLIEKDFWVCWMLGRIFETEAVGSDVVFKGGTSLSKVFKAIKRFSEDIDLSVSPERLGFDVSGIEDATSSQRKKRFKELQDACGSVVQQDFQMTLESVVRAVLGAPPGDSWLSYEYDDGTESHNLLFAYPSNSPGGRSYIRQTVKLEFGSLTDQQPTGAHTIEPLVNVLGSDLEFDDLHVNVVALDLERTFWEKATILHAEYHRPADAPFKDRLARHYSDFAALWHHERRHEAVADTALLESVVRHKRMFFSSGYANYQNAKPGSLRLVPPDARVGELGSDYTKMGEMFMESPPSFAEVLGVIREAEREINRA